MERFIMEKKQIKIDNNLIVSNIISKNPPLLNRSKSNLYQSKDHKICSSKEPSHISFKLPLNMINNSRFKIDDDTSFNKINISNRVSSRQPTARTSAMSVPYISHQNY